MPPRIVTRIGIVAAVATAVAAGSLAAYGSVFGFDNPRAIAHTSPSSSTTRSDESSTTAASSTTTTRPRPTTSTAHPTAPEPPTVKLPAGSFGFGSSGPAVLAYEQRLAALHFDPGPVDGRYDQRTYYAVVAVQKLYGLARTGTIDGPTTLALNVFRWPTSQVPATQQEPDRVEIDLDRQVLIVYQHWAIRLITTTSTGSGERYCGGDDGCQYAVTPPGKYAFSWYYNGWRTSKLGHLYKPYYFNGGIAVHGYTSVPNHAASHGCARIPMFIADYFHTLVQRGEPVYVFGTPSGPLTPPTPIPTTIAPSTSSVPPATTTTAPKSTTTTTKPKPTTTTTKPSTTTTTHAGTTTTT